MFGKKMLNNMFGKITNFTKKSNNINILHSRLILYFILFLSIINLTFNGLIGNFLIPTLFILIGIVTSFFSKNMVVILTISLITSNIIVYGTQLNYNEGMETNENIKKDEDDGEVVPYQKKNKEETEVDEKQLEGMSEQYKELMELQDKILGNFDNLDESLTTAEKLVENLGKAILR
jgi:hypothetical protein